jgi:hypothetical protein
MKFKRRCSSGEPIYIIHSDIYGLAPRVRPGSLRLVAPLEFSKELRMIRKRVAIFK